MNPIAEMLTGWTAGDAVDLPLERVFVIRNELTGQPAENPAHRVLKEGVIVGLANHTVLITKDQQHRPIDDSAAPIRSPDGAITGAVLVFRDITERKAAEDELRESEARFTQLADNISQLAWMADERGSIFWYNRRWYEFTGTTFNEMRGDGWQRVLHPIDREPVILRLQRCFDSGSVWEDTFRLRAADETYRWFLSRAMPIRDSSGTIDRWFGTCTDITQQRENQEALQDLAARLSEADRRKDTFLATLAHELRNPLAPITTGLEVMRLSAGDAQQLEEIRRTMERQTRQLVALVDDLLDVSRITRGKLELRKCPVLLSDVLGSALEAARPVIDQAGHQLAVEIPTEPMILFADPHRLTQVFSNLLNNAAKYTPEGGRVHLAVQRHETLATVSICDTGIGIPDEKREKIFEMFGQLEHPMQRGSSGLGIGLTLVKSLVEMHGGTIEVQSDGVGQGSEFVVRLPLAEPTSLTEPVSPPTEVTEPTASLRVLVADDNAAAAELLSIALSMLGHEVRTARDGLEALSIGAEFLPHVVLMDIGMPNLNGYDAARRMREQAWGQELVLVAVTGWGQEEDKQRAREAGFDHHLVKPVELTDLRRLLSEPRTRT